MSLREDLIRHQSVPSFLISLDKQMWCNQKWPNNPHEHPLNSLTPTLGGGVLLNITLMDQFTENCYLSRLLAVKDFCRNAQLKAWRLKSGSNLDWMWDFNALFPLPADAIPPFWKTSEAKATITVASATLSSKGLETAKLNRWGLFCRWCLTTAAETEPWQPCLPVCV